MQIIIEYEIYKEVETNIYLLKLDLPRISKDF